MKRILSVIIILLLLITLSSCTKKSDTAGSESRPVVVFPDGSIPTVTVETSDNSSSTASKESSSTQSDPINIIYVGNKNSKIFHKETCKSVSKMKSENMISFNSVEEAVENGYKPCGSCLK